MDLADRGLVVLVEHPAYVVGARRLPGKLDIPEQVRGDDDVEVPARGA